MLETERVLGEVLVKDRPWREERGRHGREPGERLRTGERFSELDGSRVLLPFQRIHLGRARPCDGGGLSDPFMRRPRRPATTRVARARPTAATRPRHIRRLGWKQSSAESSRMGRRAGLTWSTAGEGPIRAAGGRATSWPGLSTWCVRCGRRRAARAARDGGSKDEGAAGGCGGASGRVRRVDVEGQLGVPRPLSRAAPPLAPSRQLES